MGSHFSFGGREGPSDAGLRDVGSLSLAVRALGWGLLLPLLLRLLPLPVLLRLLTSRQRPSPNPRRPPGKVADIVRAVTWRVPMLRRRPCLYRSLLLYKFLREGGLPVRIHFGVIKTGKGLVGHSWLTLYGEPFLEKRDPGEHFAETFSFPPEGRPR